MHCVRRLIGLGLVLFVALSGPARAEDAPFRKGSRTRGLIGGWGHSWRPIFGQTTTKIAFGAFQPRMGWFVIDRGELYGEATLFFYHAPEPDFAAGAGALAGRYYFRTSGRWIPYALGGGGLLWTSQDVREIDRIFNFQLFFGVGVRQNKPAGPRWVLEFRNHHISNADTVLPNYGINAAMVLTGVEWVLNKN
jgi:hypothetical protein